MQITEFKISNDRKNIIIGITQASAITSLLFWTDKTYKDYSKAIDLTTFLTGDSTESVTIPLSMLELAYFDGVYFIEANDPDNISSSVTSDLTRYKECILNKLLEYAICEECFKKESIQLINAHALLVGLENAIEAGFVNEIFIILKGLNLYCSDECKTCGDYKNIVDTNYYSTN